MGGCSDSAEAGAGFVLLIFYPDNRLVLKPIHTVVHDLMAVRVILPALISPLTRHGHVVLRVRESC